MSVREQAEPIEFTCQTPEELVLDIRVRQDANPDKKARFYFWHQSDTVLSDLTRRINGVSRPYRFYRREVLPTLVEVLALGDTKFKWSSWAGCWCPCTPGFICDSPKLRGLVVYTRIRPL